MEKVIKDLSQEMPNISKDSPAAPILILEAIKHLKLNPHFKIYKDLIIDNKLNIEENTLHGSTDHDSIMRSQGAIKAIKEISDLESKEEFYLNVVGQKQGR